MSQFRCMKAPSQPVDPKDLIYPQYSSYKLDGIRCTIREGQPMSTSYTPLPSAYAHKFCRPEWDGLDGELIARDARLGFIYKDTHSAVMTGGSEVPLIFHVFDWVRPYSYMNRRPQENDPCLDAGGAIQVLEQRIVTCPADVYAHEQEALDAGKEGLMIRTFQAPYRIGKSTIREGYMRKMVRWLTSEAVVLKVYERMHNANEVQVSNLGLTKRSTHQENMVPMGMMGGFTLKDIVTGVIFDCATGEGLDVSTRVAIWAEHMADPAKWCGALVKYKYKPYGVDKKPRHPNFIWKRDKIDM